MSVSDWCITDPWFYVMAVPAVILLGISKSGFGIGFGALAVPMLAMTVTVPQAAAILMPVLFFLDILGLAALRQHCDRALLRFLLPWGLVGTVMGYLSFGSLDAHLVSGLVGSFTLAFLAQRLLFPVKADSPPPPRWLGRVLVTLGGFTSFIAHTGGPPINAYVLPMRLAPMTFTATMAVLFFYLNLAKWVPYGMLGLLDWRNLGTSALLLPCAPIGVWLGLKIARNIQPALFYRLAHLGLFLTGSKLVWDAVFGA